MADDHVCITASPHAQAVPVRDRLWPCMRRGQHWASCADPDTCRGCVARSAQKGHMCSVCYDRLTDALTRLAWLTAHLRSIEKPAAALGERVATSMERSILMPDSWIAADELMTALGFPVIPSTATIDDAVEIAHGNVETWSRNIDDRVNTIDGALQGMVLLKRMNIALRRWPDSDARPRRIVGMYCPACGWDHLWHLSPSKFKDDERVFCGTDGCGYSFPWLLWTAQNAPRFEEFQAFVNRRVDRESAQ